MFPSPEVSPPVGWVCVFSQDPSTLTLAWSLMILLSSYRAMNRLVPRSSHFLRVSYNLIRTILSRSDFHCFHVLFVLTMLKEDEIGLGYLIIEMKVIPNDFVKFPVNSRSILPAK